MVRCGSAPFPCCQEGRRTTLDTPFLPLLPAWLPSAVQLFPGCAPSSWEIFLVCSFEELVGLSERARLRRRWWTEFGQEVSQLTEACF